MKRTPQQNKALHKYFEILPEALNDAGLEMKAVFEIKEVDVPWSKETVKEVLWRPIQLAMTEKGSTTELTSGEPNRIYEVLDRHLSEKFGLHVEFPHEESH